MKSRFGYLFRWLLLTLFLPLAGCFSAMNTAPTEPAPLTTFEAVVLPTAVVDVDPEIQAASQIGAAARLPVDPGSPPHPMSIEALRQRTYAGSDFVIEQVLAPGSNYSQSVVSYQSDGLKINALLTVPSGERPPTGWPVVIFNHGYIPPDQYRTTERYVAYVDAFASNGYIVIKSDYRGHGSSEGEPESAYMSSGYTIDVLNAVAAARRLPDADPNRIGMWGHSMGGYITLRAMVADQGIQAGVIWAGVVASYDEMFRSWFGGGGSNRRNALVQEHGTPEANPAFWNALSANSYLSDLSGPIQIHHGLADTTVPYEYSTMLDEQIRAAGKHTELLLYDGDDHNIATNRDDALLVSVVFFNQWVKGSYQS